MTRWLTFALVMTLVAATGGCSVLGGGAGEQRLTAYFAKAPSLYEKSRVKVMGADVGGIRDVEVEGTRVRVELSVRRDVPLPRDVHAAIVPANTLGERNIVLYPPWRSGQPKAGPGTVIPKERTELPVEIDEALTAFTRLAESLDPDKVRDVVRRGAYSLDGRGPTLNRALRSTAEVTGNLAAQDQRLIEVARGLREIAAGINRRQGQLADTIDAFAATGGILAGERDRLTRFLSGLELLVRRGKVLVTAFETTLPDTAANLSELVMTIKANSASLTQAIKGLSDLTDVVVASWDRQRHVVTVRIVLNATLRAWLQPIFDAMGWGRVPCLPGQVGNLKLSNCTGRAPR